MGSNVDLVNEAYAAFGRGDIAAVIGMLADDVQWTSPETLVHGGTFKGTGEVMQFFQGIGEAWDGLSLDIESVDALGPDQVAGLVRTSATRRTSGATVGYGAVHVFTLHDGKIVRWREFVDIDAPIT